MANIFQRYKIHCEADFSEEEIDEFNFVEKNSTGTDLRREEARASAWKMIQFFKMGLEEVRKDKLKPPVPDS